MRSALVRDFNPSKMGNGGNNATAVMLAEQASSNFKSNSFNNQERRIKKRFYLANEENGEGWAQQHGATDQQSR